MPTVMRKWDAKDPADTADYWYYWGWFLPANSVIVSADVTVPAGLTKVDQEIIGKKVRVRLSGGTLGVTYAIPCVVTLDTDEEFPVIALLPIAERRQT